MIKSVVDGSLIFLTGHSNVITTLALSKCGRYVASGQRTEMGQKVSYYIVKDVHKVNFISELVDVSRAYEDAALCAAI